MLETIAIGALLSLVFMYFRGNLNKPPIQGVYQQPARWFYLKQWIIYLAISYNKRKSTAAVGHSKAGYGRKANADAISMELPQKLSDHLLAIDAVWFGGGNKDGVYLVISGARRKQRVMQSMVFIYVPGIGLLQSPKHPETAMFQTEQEADGWAGEGIHLEPVQPLKQWRVRYQGELIHEEKKTLHAVSLDATYNTSWRHFDFDSDMDAWTVGRAMAREPWSREYFHRLRAAHQNHYEQFGIVSGDLTIDGTTHKISIDVMKDHTHGSIRDWTLMHRYTFHQFATTSGIRGFLGIVSQPGTLSCLELGWIQSAAGQPQPVQEVDFQIWNYGEGGEDTGDYGFRFRAGGIWYNVQVRLKHRQKGRAYFGWDWEARIVERFCRYEINGEEGWGISEWEYRNKGGRPLEVAASDPAHIVRSSVC